MSLHSHTVDKHELPIAGAADSVLPPPRPVLWPLRSVATAKVNIAELADGRRRIVIEHAELTGVTPVMLAWWYANVVGEMEYAGQILPRYMVWHPLDHISYEIVGGRPPARPGTRLHIVEAFQRNPANRLDLHVTLERLDEQEARIGRRLFGMEVMQLSNRFQATTSGTQYTTIMTIGSASWAGRLGLNRLLRSRILPGEQVNLWIRHHVEEIGNLVNFLPSLFRLSHKE
jgi:hypothetical protein